MKHKRFDRLGEELYVGQLRNGLRICVVTKPRFKTGYAVLAVNYGGAHRSFFLDGVKHDTPAGVAHFLEHKMFDMPDGSNALNTLSANGAKPNAFTSSGMTAYYFDCADHFEDNLRTLLTFVSTPYFTQDTVDKEQGIIGQEISMVEDRPGYVIYNRLMRMLYKHHPIRDQVAGSCESISRITADTLYNCHKAFYAPSNMALCVAADCDAERIFRIAEELLPAEKSEAPRADMGQKELDAPEPSYSEERMEVSAPQFLIGAKVTPAPLGDGLLRQRMTAQLALRTVFGSSGSFFNRLYSDGLLNRDYDYEIDYSAGTAAFILGGESRDPKSVLREVCSELVGIFEHGLDEKAFDLAKKACFGTGLRSIEDLSDLCLSLADGIFGGYCALDAPDVLESITKADCERFLNEFLTPDKLAMSVILPTAKERS